MPLFENPEMPDSFILLSADLTFAIWMVLHEKQALIQSTFSKTELGDQGLLPLWGTREFALHRHKFLCCLVVETSSLLVCHWWMMFRAAHLLSSLMDAGIQRSTCSLVVAAFAKESAFSLPGIPTWAGTGESDFPSTFLKSEIRERVFWISRHYDCNPLAPHAERIA